MPKGAVSENCYIPEEITVGFPEDVLNLPE